MPGEPQVIQAPRTELQPAAAAAVTHDGRPPVLASADLLRGGRLVEIRHNGEIYRLQSTRLGKLILTK